MSGSTGPKRIISLRSPRFARFAPREVLLQQTSAFARCKNANAISTESSPVRVSRGPEGSGGVEQKTCLSGASLFCVRHSASTGVCLRSRPNGVGVAGSPEGEPVPPLGPSGEDTHVPKCDDLSVDDIPPRRRPPSQQNSLQRCFHSIEYPGNEAAPSETAFATRGEMHTNPDLFISVGSVPSVVKSHFCFG